MPGGERKASRAAALPTSVLKIFQTRGGFAGGVGSAIVLGSPQAKESIVVGHIRACDFSLAVHCGERGVLEAGLTKPVERGALCRRAVNRGGAETQRDL